MRVFGGFRPAEDRGDAGVGSVEDRHPVVAGLLREDIGIGVPARRPLAGVHLGRLVILGQSGQPHQFGEELRLQRADRQELAVGAGIGAIEGRAAVEQIGLARLAPLAAGDPGMDQRHQGRGAVDHRRIDHLPLAGGLPFEQRGHDAEQQEHGAAGIVGADVQRRCRHVIGAAGGVQKAGEAEVVDIMPRHLGHRPILPPAGHAGEDQPRVAALADVRAQPHPLHHAGAEPFDQHVGTGDQRQCRLDSFGRLQVQRGGSLAAVVDVGRIGGAGFAGDQDHLRPEIGEELAGQRGRSQPLHLDDPEALERPAHAALASGLRSRSSAPSGMAKRSP